MVKFMIHTDKLREQVKSRQVEVRGRESDDNLFKEKPETFNTNEKLESQGLVLFELQGELETVHEDVKGKEVGRLQFEENGTPIIRVGHWTIAGQIIELEKPIMVVKRRSPPLQQITPDRNNVKSDNMKLDIRSESSILAENFQRLVGMVSELSKDLEIEDYDDDSLEANEILKPRINSYKPKVFSKDGQGRSSDKEMKLENLNVEYDAVQVFKRIYLFRSRPIPVMYGH